MQGSELLSPSSQSGNCYHAAVAALCRAVLSCTEVGSHCLEAGEVFMLGILREATSSCSALVLCSSLVLGFERGRLVLFPQALKSPYALLWKVSAFSLKTGDSQRHVPQLFLQSWAITPPHRDILSQMITLEIWFSKNWDFQERAVN